MCHIIVYRFLAYFPKKGKTVCLEQLCSILHSLPRDLVAELHFAIALPSAEQWRAVKIVFENICRKSQRIHKLRADLHDLIDDNYPASEQELELLDKTQQLYAVAEVWIRFLYEQLHRFKRQSECLDKLSKIEDQLLAYKVPPDLG